MAQTVIPVPGPETIVLSLNDVTAIGPPGAQGPQGIQGPIGPTGPVGPPLNIKGSKPNSAALPSSGNTIGDTWITLDTGHAWSWSGTSWIDAGPFTGPQGSTGPTGPTGPVGPGSTVVAGTTTTGAAGTSANVVNVGTSSAAIFNFTIPQGIQGVIGPTGSTGSQGPTGSSGPQGPAGPPGPPLNMKGTVASSANLPTTGNTIGDLYLALDTGHGWSWNGTAWVDTGPFQGPQGNPGTSAITTSSASFTVPAVGSTVLANVADSTFAVIGEMVWVTKAASSTQAGVMLVTAKVTGQLTLQTPAQAPGVAVPGIVVPSGAQVSPAGPQGVQGVQGVPGPTAVSTDAGNLATIGTDSKILVPQSSIWNMRLRNFNSIGNSNFEVTQRNCGSALTNPASNTFIEDRWSKNGAGTYGITVQVGSSSGFALPGLPFAISSRYLSVILTAQETTLGAGDFLYFGQMVEGPFTRELIADVSSVSLYCWCNAALNFGVALRDSAGARSLTKLCTIPASVYTVVTLPNLPSFNSAGGTFNLTPGNLGYYFGITLACGTTYMAPANDTWQNGNFLGAVGQDNFCAKPVNTEFRCVMVQHEPGSVCTNPMDCPFTGPNGNLAACQRYFQKSYPYGVKPGSVGNAGCVIWWSPNAAINYPYVHIPFKQVMAKTTPTIAGYSTNTGAVNNVYVGAADIAVSSVVSPGDYGFSGFNLASNAAAMSILQAHYTADTGW